MKLPALRAKIGNWVYYTTTLTFEEVNKYVERVDDQLHKSEGLRDLIQRSLTKNFQSIRDYILNQEERFFNALVLAVYDGIPDWIEVELKLGDEDFFNMGFLEFPGNQKIFPLDGQHRVEGIKAALELNENLKNEKITVIFVGHKNDEKGMQKSRRLFTTLNRYAKPVTMDDIIALDEDDSIAIITRNLLENFDLFMDDRVTKSKSKAIIDKDKNSFTSIITLYQCNRELLKIFRKHRKKESPNSSRDKKNLDEYLKLRPDDEEIIMYEKLCLEFWHSFRDKIPFINEFLQNSKRRIEQPALKFRNSDNGGNLLFRPVGLLPFIQAVIEVHNRTEQSFEAIFDKYISAEFNINEIPWKNVLWNPNEKTMIMGNQGLVKLFFLYFFDNIIRNWELEALKKRYADRISFEGDNLDEVLIGIK
ncbi:MAG TPA: DndB [Ignavibacteriales bacterium]|nr:DndB [Ignavibacteriales bacterium]